MEAFELPGMLRGVVLQYQLPTNLPEEEIPQLYRGGNLRSRTDRWLPVLME